MGQLVVYIMKRACQGISMRQHKPLVEVHVANKVYDDLWTIIVIRF